jgi:integrase
VARRRSLEARTRSHYRRLLERQLLPQLKDVPLRHITPDLVREWHATTALDTPTLRSHAYGLLRTILGQAVRDELIRSNPCHIRGGGNAKRVKKIKPATLAELEAVVGAMPERYRVMVLLASWCGLRFGELAELRRGDVNTKSGTIHVRRGVVRADGKTLVKKPKSDAGVRDVAIPPTPTPPHPPTPAHPRGGGQGRTAVPGARRRSPGTVQLVPSVLPGAGGRWSA